MQQPGSTSAAIPAAALAGNLPLELGKKRAAENDMYQLVLRCYLFHFICLVTLCFDVDYNQCMMIDGWMCESYAEDTRTIFHFAEIDYLAAISIVMGCSSHVQTMENVA